MVFLITLTGFGQSAFGAQRWFTVAVFFLDRDFAKIVAIIVLARYFEVAQFQPRDLKWAFGAVLWASGIILIILLQPNLSNVLVLSVILAVMLWVNGIIEHVVSTVAIGAVAMASLVVVSVVGVKIPFMQDVNRSSRELRGA